MKQAYWRRTHHAKPLEGATRLSLQRQPPSQSVSYNTSSQKFKEREIKSTHLYKQTSFFSSLFRIKSEIPNVHKENIIISLLLTENPKVHKNTTNVLYVSTMKKHNDHIEHNSSHCHWPAVPHWNIHKSVHWKNHYYHGSGSKLLGISRRTKRINHKVNNLYCPGNRGQQQLFSITRDTGKLISCG